MVITVNQTRDHSFQNNPSGVYLKNYGWGRSSSLCTGCNLGLVGTTKILSPTLKLPLFRQYFNNPDDRTQIHHNNKDYFFEGFSIFSHYPLGQLIPAETMRYHTKYSIHFIQQNPPPRNFCLDDLILFQNFCFRDVLELKDWLETLVVENVDLEQELAFKFEAEADQARPKLNKSTQQYFYFMPRFIYRDTPKAWSGIYQTIEELRESKIQARNSNPLDLEILPMRVVLEHLLENFKPIITEDSIKILQAMTNLEWDEFIQPFRGQIAMLPGARPSSIRIDQIDQRVSVKEYERYDEILII